MQPALRAASVTLSPAVMLTRHGEHQKNAFCNQKSKDSKAAVTLSPAVILSVRQLADVSKEAAG